MSQNYIAINASAGSGKTYNLVQRLLIICLRYPKNEKTIGQILALTFTNKAANEMKERIISWLGNFIKDDYAENNDLKAIKEVLETEGIHVTMQDLHERSKNLLNYILHNYSILNIGTIDKFNSKLVRSFSNELGLAHQFNLEINSEPFLIEAVDKTLDEIGENELISEAFMDFVNYNLDNEERVNINKTLYKNAKKFVNDIHYEELKSNRDFDWDAYEQTKNALRKEISELQIQNESIARNSLETIQNAGLTEEDFQGKSNGIAAVFRKYLDSGDFPFPTNEENAVANFRKGTTSKDFSIKSSVESILETLITNREKMIESYISFQKKEKILKELLPLKINKEIQDQLQLIEDENDVVLLSKFNVLINENLKNEPSQFIYEKIGTRFQHFFLDEFQDTSKMQWENLIPLKDNAIYSEGNSFTLVGDPKQSIYRFRGGDSDLMLQILQNNAAEILKTIQLRDNWRSAVNIVEFNNELYGYISGGLREQHRDLFSDKAKQNPQKKFLGRVKVNLTDYSKSLEPFFENVCLQMQQDIQQCVENGFKFSDITILCRTAKEIQKFSQLLGTKKVNYQDNEIYIKTISEKGMTLSLSITLKALIEFLNWQAQPKNLQFLARALYHLNDLGKIKMSDYTAESIAILEKGTKEKIENFLNEKYNLNLKTEQLSSLNLYNTIEHYVREFSVKGKETDFLLNFLEMLYNFTQNTGASLKDFLKFWEEEGQDISIQTSENVDAIKLMTIHAAKGLEFPVVFLPMLNTHKDYDFTEWFSVENYEGLKSVNIKNFNSGLEIYDEEIENFNAENSYKNSIDRLCVQYVATTRAEEQLFLYIQKPSEKSQGKLEIYHFLQSKNMENLDEFDLFPEVGNSFHKQNSHEEKLQKTMDITSISSSSPMRNNIKIATPSKNYQNRNEYVRKGILTHDILAEIRTEKDVPKVLEKYVLDGKLTQAESEEIAKSVETIIKKHPEYFQKDTPAIMEKDIMVSESGTTEIYRPDRLVKLDDGWHIIDFKTGAEKLQDQKQVENYKRILEGLGMKVAGMEVVYV